MYRLHNTRIPGPLFDEEAKDPCIVFSRREWLMYGTECTGAVCSGIFRARSESLEGPWVMLPAISVPVRGSCVAAPSVVFDSGIYHMFMQTTCWELGGDIIHLDSEDGKKFVSRGVSLSSQSGDEAGLYDPDAAIIHRKRYLAYTGMPRVSHGDIFLAEFRDTWDSPLKRIGRILSHEDIAWHHNPHDFLDYEWGIEGAQLLELPSGLILLNAVSFLPRGKPGTRQRIFFAFAENPGGPYCSIGPVIAPAGEGWESGENGHGYAVIHSRYLYLFYQARAPGKRWHIGCARYDLDEIERAGHDAIR